MLRIIEHSETHLLQKVIAPKMVVYQVVPKSSIGDSSAIQRFNRLYEARNAAGIVYRPPQTVKK